MPDREFKKQRIRPTYYFVARGECLSTVSQKIGETSRFGQQAEVGHGRWK
jgi:hypothetical protein